MRSVARATMLHAATIALLGAAILMLAPAQAPASGPRVFANAPAAVWIAPPGMPPTAFGVFHARRTIDLPGRPDRFLVHVSADNRYRLYVNGTEVASGPQRSDIVHWRYETVDLAPQLRAGANTIAAVVWTGGPRHPVAQHSARSGFLLQGDSPREAIANTGSGWRLLIDSAYAELAVSSQDVRGAYYAATQGELVDGTRYPWGWEGRDYRDEV